MHGQLAVLTHESELARQEDLLPATCRSKPLSEQLFVCERSIDIAGVLHSSSIRLAVVKTAGELYPERNAQVRSPREHLQRLFDIESSVRRVESGHAHASQALGADQITANISSRIGRDHDCSTCDWLRSA